MLEDADLLLLVGTDFPYRQFIPEGKTVVQIDSRPEHLGRRTRLDYGVAGDAPAALRGLCDRVGQKSDDSHLRKALKIEEEARRKLEVYVRHSGGQSSCTLSLWRRCSIGSRPRTRSSFPTLGCPRSGACRYLNMIGGRRLIGSFNHGSMANAMPRQTIGAQLGYPGRQVVAMCGDGGLTMLLGDLSTIAAYDLSIKLIVFDNGLLDMVHWECSPKGLSPTRRTCTILTSASSLTPMGSSGSVSTGTMPSRRRSRRRLSTPAALVSIKTAGLAAGMPQYPTWQQVKGFAEANAKLVWHGHPDQVVDLAKDSIRDITQYAPHRSSPVSARGIDAFGACSVPLAGMGGVPRA